MPTWVIAVLRVLGIRSAADVVPVATKIADQVHDLVDPPEPGQPLPYKTVQHIQRQIESATSHKVPPPGEPRTGNRPARVVAASAPGRPAPFASPPEGGGAAGTQGARPCMKPPVEWRCTRERDHDGPCAVVPLAGGPGLAKAVNRTIITPREGTPVVPPRPRKEPNK